MAQFRNNSMGVADISRFRSDHTDYDGMSVSEKRRAITKLLRQCNFLVNSTLIDHARVQQARESVTSPKDASYDPLKVQMHANGIVWVRCNENGGALPQEGEPVIFDIETGTEVTSIYKHGLSSGRFYEDRIWNDDEYVIVGYALRRPFADEAGFYQVPILMVRYDGFKVEGGQFLAGPVSSDELRSPQYYEDIDIHYIEPGHPGDGGPAWREMNIQHYGLNNSPGIGGDAVVNYNTTCERAVVINPYPFGFLFQSGRSQSLKVHRSGGCYVIDRPLQPFHWPMFSAAFGASETSSGLAEYLGPSHLNPIIYGDDGVTMKWLPVDIWRYRVHGYADLTWTGGNIASQNITPITLNIPGVFVVPGYSVGGGVTLETAVISGHPAQSVISRPSTGGAYRTWFDQVVEGGPYTPDTSIQFLFNGGTITGAGVSAYITIEPIF